MGDVELLSDPAPIEIGNRVWSDLNNNGVQDPDEAGIAGIVVSLQTISGTITTTTNISGTYYFTREATSGAYSTTLRTNTAYFQKEVAGKLRLKYAARIKFLPDESFDEASRIDSLLDDPRVRRDLG